MKLLPRYINFQNCLLVVTVAKKNSNKRISQIWKKVCITYALVIQKNPGAGTRVFYIV